MIDRLSPSVLGLAALLPLGCGIFGVEDEPEITDGEVCRSDDECSTGTCTNASLCSHSPCRCPSGICAPEGEQTDACREGWVCVGYDAILDPVREFFDVEAKENDGYCRPLCDGGCPEHYMCDGMLCRPDEYWAYPTPIVVWTGAVSGESGGRDATAEVEVEEGATVMLEGFAESPTDTEITAFTWTTVTDSGEYLELEGPSIEITVPTGPTGYRRVELAATDAMGRTGMTTVIFDACFGAGTACGYEGSGCCTSCDDATSTCR